MGFQKNIKKAGNGPKPAKGQHVTVECTGLRPDGSKFWSTKDPGQKPFAFDIGLGRVIKGWDEGVMTMQLGEEAELVCSPDYAYGAAGFPAWGIGQNSELTFIITVLKIE